MAEKPVVAPASFDLELELPAPRSAPTAASSRPASTPSDLDSDEEDGAALPALEVVEAPRNVPIAPVLPSVPPAAAPASRIRPLPLDAPVSSRLAPSSGSVAAPGPPASRIEPPSELRDLGAKMSLSIRLIAVALGITVIDVLVTRFSGETLMVGPVRPAWVAGPLALVGVALAFWRIFRPRDDD